ncbi:MAG TPA: neutral zinc metallopeptidase [Novosphingobium sp.]|nr:neutral zinc metallopeptidase [Novosphingobium sp.]
MRLDNFDPDDVNIEDQRGGGGGMGLPGVGGGLGLGVLLLAAGAWALGFDPMTVLNLAGGEQARVEAPAGDAPARSGKDAASSCTIDQASRESCNALSSLNKTWRQLFAAGGKDFAKPKLVFYSSRGSSGCGAAQSAMGPFYCPADRGIYLDTDFYREMDQKLGASGSFARDYVIAHEYGHHVQNLRGVSAKVSAAERANPDAANRYSVMLELQADCYAGVWAAKNRDRMEAGDMESGLNAAHQIGDDVLMKNAGRTPNEAAFTHGSAAQRMQWLRRGMETGDPGKCNTFREMGGM